MLTAFAFAALRAAIFRLLRNAAIIPAPVTISPSVIPMVAHTHPHSLCTMMLADKG
jgi:hypothetical protein